MGSTSPQMSRAGATTSRYRLELDTTVESRVALGLVSPSLCFSLTLSWCCTTPSRTGLSSEVSWWPDGGLMKAVVGGAMVSFGHVATSAYREFETRAPGSRCADTHCRPPLHHCPALPWPLLLVHPSIPCDRTRPDRAPPCASRESACPGRVSRPEVAIVSR